MKPRKSKHLPDNWYCEINYTLGRPFLRHLNLATFANFWKSLNLSGAKIKISLFFHFLTKRENGKKSSISRQNTDQYCVSTSFSVLNNLFCY